MEKRFEPDVRWDDGVFAYLSSSLPNFPSIQTALTRPPKDTCLRVNTLKTSTQEVVAELNALASASITHAQQPPLSTAACHPQAPMAIMLPGHAPAGEIDYSVTGGKEVAITRKTGEAVLRGAPVYAPGVLACSAHVSPGDLVAVSIATELPNSDWCGITRGSVLSEANRAHTREADRAALHVGIGRAHLSRQDMFRQASGVAVSIEHPVFPVPLPLAGLKAPAMLQNLPSIVAAMALKPQPGCRVLDMCASPGGKASMIAQLMEDRGTVIALDRTQAKADQVTSLAQELGLTIIQAHRMDATKALLKQQGDTGATKQELRQQPPAPSAASLAAGAEKVQKRAARKQAARLRHGMASHVDAGTSTLPQPQHHQQQPEETQQQQQQEQQQRQPEQQQQQQQPEQMQQPQLPQPQQPQHLQQQQQQQHGEDQQQSHAGMATEHEALQPLSDEPSHASMSSKHEASQPLSGAPSNSSPVCFPPESFDAVLLDAPCSALGLRPRLMQTATPLYLIQCGLYARKLLDTAVRLVRPGGRLVFSTCTISPFENEANTRYLLDRYRHCIRLVPAEPRVGGPGLSGRHPYGGICAVHEASNRTAGLQGEGDEHQRQAASGEGSSAHDWDEVWLSEEEAAMVQRFDPAAPTDTIGFYVAAFEKIGAVG